MKNIILFDSELRDQLLPFTFLRPVSELRVGIMTLREKWKYEFPMARFSHITTEHLEPLYPIEISDDNLLINSGLLPDPESVLLLKNLGSNQAILSDDELIAARLNRAQFDRLIGQNALDELEGIVVEADQLKLISRLWHLLDYNADEIVADVRRYEKSESRLIRKDTITRGDHSLYCFGDIDLSGVMIDTSNGPIIIGAGASILPGAMISGPAAIGASSRVKMGSMIYGGTTLGPLSMVAGEIKNSLIMGYTNKGHEGYLGDSVLGYWCNIGALSSNSNLKNSFGSIKLWDYRKRAFEDSGRIKCGLFMGDYSRCAIHTTFNSGCVVGVSAHVMESDFPPKFIPSFTWGQSSEYELSQAIKAARTLQEFKGQSMDAAEADLLTNVYGLTQDIRAGFMS